MVAFVPYFFFYGMLGKYVWQIAAVVIISLAFSLVEAMIILPAHIAHSKAIHQTDLKETVLKRIRKKFDNAFQFVLNRVYKPILAFSLGNRWLVTGGIVAMMLVIIGLFQGSHVHAQLHWG